MKGHELTSNEDIRQAMKAAGVAQWQIAEEMNCHEAKVQRMLRKELPQEEKKHFLQIIHDVAQKEGEQGGTVDRK